MDITRPIQAQTLVLAGGVRGRALVVPSATPRNFEAIVQGGPLPPVALHAALFAPPRSPGSSSPAVIIVPGSGGVLPPLLAHAQALLDVGIAALLLDPFGGRGVVNTIAEQRQIPFAASAYDIFAAMCCLADEPDIDITRLGALGYSRGGVAVLAAALRVLATPSLQSRPPLKAVLAGWPWCGYQFLNPDVGDTAVRLVAADRDNWASPVQTQALHAVLRARGAKASFRLVRDAHHGFGYGVPIKAFPDAMVALNAPIIYFDDDGVMLDPWSGDRRPGADDAVAVQMLAPYVAKGVTVGASEGQMADFMREFSSFFSAELAS